jgi:aldehyde dehydrogenase (NAD+)
MRGTVMPAATTTEALLIGGNKVPASDNGALDVYDPSTGEIFTKISKATAQDVDAAVNAAHAALDSKEWGGIVPAERGRILLRIAAKIRERGEELAALESRDNGKPLRQARTDVAVSARYFEFYGGVADKLMGATIPVAPGIMDFTVKEPIGVSAQIIPWNYPIQIGSRASAPALAAGCAVVMKPSQEASMTALRLGEIALECGLPAGALNIVTGSGKECGAALASHPGINQLTFTGSLEVGTGVAQVAARNVIPSLIELGGKSPNIVFADANLDTTVPGVANAIFQAAGQTCSAGSRLLVERSVQAALVDRLIAHARAMRVGPGLEDPDMGPVISMRQLEVVEAYVQSAIDEGAVVRTGGKRLTGLAGGFFYEPTLIDRVTPRMRVAQEEIFGPVLTIIPFDSVEEAVALANDSQYGLLAGVWTRDINKAMSVATRVKCGQVYVNTYGAGGGVELPFGGYKKSGYGRGKGMDALNNYLQVKNICIRYA